MKILKIWIFTLGGQQLFFKEYERIEPSDNLVANLLNTGVISSFLTFFNNYLMKRLCNVMLFGDIVFNFDYSLGNALKNIILVITRIDLKFDLEVQLKVLHTVARKIGEDFHDCYKEVFEQLQHNLNGFKPFEDRCDEIINNMAGQFS
ncbi:MAG: hypothetical protein LUQ65_12140 [Candidatus Helarchaeota archaeon]|nr:hypothetical protein [Candidatus Helarchaeota archaeon]